MFILVFLKFVIIVGSGYGNNSIYVLVMLLFESCLCSFGKTDVA